MTQIYIDSWNQGFGHLLGRRNVTADRVERMRIDITQKSSDWSVAEVDGHVVGFISIGPSREPLADDFGELESIAVDPPHWRQGIGRALMELALDQLASRWQRAILWTPAGHDGPQPATTEGTASTSQQDGSLSASAVLAAPRSPSGVRRSQ